MPTVWTEERVAEAEEMRRHGASAACIAINMSQKHGTKLSRNSVIGMFFRKPGLAGKPAKPRNAVPRRPRPAKPRKVELFKAPIELLSDDRPINDVSDLAIPKRQRRTFQQLTSTTCRWPVGQPGSPDFFFCGGVVAHKGSPYCLQHDARAHAPRPRQDTPVWREAQAAVESEAAHEKQKLTETKTKPPITAPALSVSTSPRVVA